MKQSHSVSFVGVTNLFFFSLDFHCRAPQNQNTLNGIYKFSACFPIAFHDDVDKKHTHTHSPHGARERANDQMLQIDWWITTDPWLLLLRHLWKAVFYCLPVSLDDDDDDDDDGDIFVATVFVVVVADSLISNNSICSYKCLRFTCRKHIKSIILILRCEILITIIV